jgi:hypothetical protein
MAARRRTQPLQQARDYFADVMNRIKRMAISLDTPVKGESRSRTGVVFPNISK